MTPSKNNKICDICIHILKDVAYVLSSGSDEKPTLVLNEYYQSRLMANMSLPECHMCALIVENIPRSIEPLSSGQHPEFIIYRAKDNEEAGILEIF